MKHDNKLVETIRAAIADHIEAYKENGSVFSNADIVMYGDGFYDGAVFAIKYLRKEIEGDEE